VRLRVIFAAAAAVACLGLTACGGDDETEASANTAGTSTETTEGSEAEEEGTTAEEETAEGAESTDDGTTESGTTPGGEPEGSEKVEIVEFTYQPDPVVVRTGGKVIWQNEDTAPHTATADDGSFDTGPLERGKLKSEAFKQAGTYPYFCEIHPDMRGTVEVVAKD
jgi:plastocyanin